MYNFIYLPIIDENNTVSVYLAAHVEVLTHYCRCRTGFVVLSVCSIYGINAHPGKGQLENEFFVRTVKLVLTSLRQKRITVSWNDVEEFPRTLAF